MGLLGLLIAVTIVILLLVFAGSNLSPFNVTPQSSQNVKSKAQEVVDLEKQRVKLEQSQLNNTDIP